jgi:hypothetical protein
MSGPVAYYAMGGGLGHLVRARAVLHTLGLEAGACVLTSSPYARDPRVLGPLVAEQPPLAATTAPEALAAWLEETLARLSPSLLLVDVFPGGIVGELTRPLWPSGTRLGYVGRLLRWPVYRRRLAGPLPHFDVAYAVEPLHPDHQAAITAVCERVVELALVDPSAPPVPTVSPDTWVVLHSGPPDEVNELVEYAHAIQKSEGTSAPIRVVSADPIAALPEFPAAGYFATAARVITACGFNVMRQSAGTRARHHFMPFPRPLDDQFARAARRRG